ncbi:DNA polymerase IV [Kiloniella sp. b19]|uniref:DNA polymerase IV n=1 Tax=Kiloniella sp. GXU_MW_B19 TaxID=3141326 RepID=UPI0031E3D58A
MISLCRDCFHKMRTVPEEKENRENSLIRRCLSCGSPRLVQHGELDSLAIAHLDCDAFFASVEKRDNPELLDRPLIIGGGHRGVVSTACYIARLYGVRSAMPLYQALKACPEATVVHPDHSKYSKVGREVRDIMASLTDQLEPLSIDEAFMDLEERHTPEWLGKKAEELSVAECLVRLAKEIEDKVGITVSIGLSYNKSMAKLASDLDKPRGFSVLGRQDALEFLEDKPVRTIFGVGKSLEKKLHQDGFFTIGDIRRESERQLNHLYGAMGHRLYNFSRGIDERKISSSSIMKSISVETTFSHDERGTSGLGRILEKLCLSLQSRFERKNAAARSITLKLKTADFKTVTRSYTAEYPVFKAEDVLEIGLKCLERAPADLEYRLLGIGGSDLVSATACQDKDLLETEYNDGEIVIPPLPSLPGKNANEEERPAQKTPKRQDEPFGLFEDLPKIRKK